MGTVFTDAPIEAAVVAVQFAPIHFVAPCRYCRDGRCAMTNIRPVDVIERPMCDLNVCAGNSGGTRFLATSSQADNRTFSCRLGDENRG